MYFGIATVLLFVLAATWSVDGSLVYVMGGPIVFFVYLGLYNLSSNKIDGSNNRQDKYSISGAFASFGNTLQSFFNRKSTGFKSTYTPSTTPQSSKRFLILGVVIFMLVLFFISIVVSIFSSGDENQEIYFFNAEQYYNTRSFDSAYVNYAKAFKEDPTNEEAIIGQGNAAFEMNRLDSALNAYEQALTINPDNSEVQYKKGLILYYQKKYDPSAETLKALFEKDPTYFDALLKLGDVYYDQKRYDEALKFYDQAYANGVRNNWICYVSGYLYQEKGNTQKAVGLYKEALRYDSTVIDIYERLGALLPGSDGDFFRIKAREGSQ